MAKRQEKLGLLTEGSLGDTLLYIPTIRFLRHHFPGQEIMIIGRDPNPRINIEFILGNRFDRVVIRNYPVHRKSFANYAGLVSLGLDLRRRGLSRIFDGCRIGPDRSVARLLQKRRMIGFLSGAAVDQDTAWLAEEMKLVTEASPAPQMGELILRRTMNAAGASGNIREFSHLFPVSAADREAAQQWLTTSGLPDLSNCYVVGMKSKVACREWPVGRFLAVMRHLKEVHQLLPVFSGGPADAPLFRELIGSVSGGHIISGLSPGGEAALLAGCRFFLGVNSGPMHLAASAGLRCVVIYAEDLPAGLWYPLGNGHEVLYGIGASAPADVIAACERILNGKTSAVPGVSGM